MKFTNGYWMMREGYTFKSPAVAYEHAVRENALIVYAPCTTIEHKGKTLDGGMITIEISSPLADIIKVKAYRHKGMLHKAPEFKLVNTNPQVCITENDKTIDFKTGNLTVKVGKESGQFFLKFYRKGKLLTSSTTKALSHVTYLNETTYMKEELTLEAGELVYGLGERFTAFVKNGQTVDIWNEDGGTGSEQTYKNIPFYLSSKEYGVFVNHPEKVSYEVASEKVSRVQFAVEGEVLEYYVIGGESSKEVIKNYTTLTGKPALPPAWSFGLWLSTSFLTDYDEETVNKFIDGMKERDIPLDVFHFDCCWMKEFEWCNFEWNTDTFPEPKKMLQAIKEKGLKTCVWINPYIGQKSALFDEGMEKGYFIKRADGSVWQWDLWQAGMAVVDFTNPEACKWFQDKLEVLMDMGVDSFKTDFGERIPTDVVYFDGSDPQKMHNYYTQLYNQVVFELLERKRGKGEAVLFARSATVGGQKYPVHWGGDCVSTYASMAESLRGGLSFTLSGFGFWSHDIGGFEDGCTPDLYKRWTQFGLLSTHSRYHGSGEYKVPWNYGEEAVEVTKKFTKLKIQLMPYLFRNACETAETGVPSMRAMVLEFPEDETCHYLDRQYMLGDNILVAPIFNEEGIAKYYLPEGTWTHFLTGEVRAGEKWYKETYDYLSMPIFVRENSILVTGQEHTTAVYDYAKDITVNLYEIKDNTDFMEPIYDKAGKKVAQVNVVAGEGTMELTLGEVEGNTTIVLWNTADIKSVEGGILVQDGQNVVIKAVESKITIVK